ncbi:MAG: orotate phosphoribosyltransferase [Nitrospirae bacterium YQR-1]
MIDLIESMTARLLWETKAVRVSLDSPFKLTSGNYSPIYVNCRALISDAPAMDIISAFCHWIHVENALEADLIAGGETAGIPFAAYIAHRLAKPMVYVRKSPKQHGMGSVVEGTVRIGQSVLLIEDLITDGGSKEKFVSGLRENGLIVNHCLVIFDREQGGADFLNSMGVSLHHLCTMSAAIQSWVKMDLVKDSEKDEILFYINNPKGWHEKRGFHFIEDITS